MKLPSTLSSEKTKALSGFLSLDRIICRLLACWCIYISTTLNNSTDYLKLEFNQNSSLSKMIIWVSVSFVALSLIAFFVRKFNTDSWFLLIGSTRCVVRWCLFPPTDDNRFLFWIALGVVYSLFLIWIVHENEDLLSRFQPDKRVMLLVCFLMGILACVILCATTCLRYKTFSSPNFDFGIFVNMFHNMRKTGLPLSTCERDGLLSHFAVHISPIYYLLLPLYALFPSPYTLQIGQAVVLMLGVIPIVLLSRRYRLSRKTTIAMAALYVFYTALSTGCFYDLHENCFLPLLLLLMFLFFEKEKYLPMYLCLILTLGVKEDAAIYLLVFAFYALLSRKKYIHGTAVAVIAVGYFAVSAFVLKKYGLGMMVGRYDNLILNADDGLIGAIKTVFLNPGYLLSQLFSTKTPSYGKIVYFLELLLPLALAPFCTKKASRWILLSPLLINLVTMYGYQYNIDFQYSFGITAFLFYAAIQNTAEISPKMRKSIITVSLAFSMCLYSIIVLPKLTHYAKSAIANESQYARMEEILDTIPENASVCCSTYLLPHIADRDVIYEIAYHKGKCDVDYVVIDIRYEQFEELAQPYINYGYQEVFVEENMIRILKSPTA